MESSKQNHLYIDSKPITENPKGKPTTANKKQQTHTNNVTTTRTTTTTNNMSNENNNKHTSSREFSLLVNTMVFTALRHIFTLICVPAM